MKSFNQFLGEAEEKTPERKKLELNISKEAPGQQSLPGMGRSATRTGQGSGQGKPPSKKPTYNPKYYNADGTLKPNAVQTYIQGRMAREYNRPGVSLNPETKARLDSANKTFASAAKGDEAASKQVAQWNKEFQAKHGLKNPPSTSSVPTTKPDALGQFIRKTQETGKPVSQELTDVSGIRSSGMKPELVGGAPPTTAQVNRARAAADAIKAQQQPQRRGQGSGAQTLRRLVGPDPGMQRLQKAIDATPDAPQLPSVPKPKPAGADRVTYGRGTTAPSQSFAAFSQKADAMKPPAPAAVQQRVAQQVTIPKPKPPVAQQIVTATQKAAADAKEKQVATNTASAIKQGKVIRPIVKGLSAVNTYNYGQSLQGKDKENPVTSAVRAATVPTVASGAATSVAKSLIKRRMPKWALPAAAATYGAVEPMAQWGFSKIRDFMRGNK